MNSSQKVYTFDNLVEAAQEKKFGHAVTIDSQRPVEAFQSINAPGEFEHRTYEQISHSAFAFANRLRAAYM